MKRLTKRNENGLAVSNIKCPDECEYVTCSIEEGYQCQHQCERDVIEKLARYEDLEEQGLLLKLPCKVGDKAWYVRNCVIDEVEVDSFILNTNLLVNVSLYVGYERFRKTLTPYKTLFFTRDEAEQKLEELKELSK